MIKDDEINRQFKTDTLKALSGQHTKKVSNVSKKWKVKNKKETLEIVN